MVYFPWVYRHNKPQLIDQSERAHWFGYCINWDIPLVFTWYIYQENTSKRKRKRCISVAWERIYTPYPPHLPLTPATKDIYMAYHYENNKNITDVKECFQWHCSKSNRRQIPQCTANRNKVLFLKHSKANKVLSYYLNTLWKHIHIYKKENEKSNVNDKD